MKNISRSTNLTIKIAILAAMGLLLTYFEFPILPAFPFLKVDLGDIPALIGAFAFGPLVGIAIEAIKNILAALLKSTTGGIGELGNFLIVGAFVGSAGFFYIKNKTRKTALISLLGSIIVMVVAGLLANYFILIPLYSKFMPINVPYYLVYAVIPFNLIKGSIISLVTMLIYKRVSVLIHAESLNNKPVRNKEKSA